MGRGIDFVRTQVREGTRLRVRSECSLCGAFTVGSMVDHSIQDGWPRLPLMSELPVTRPPFGHLAHRFAPVIGFRSL